MNCIDILDLLRYNGGTLKDVICYGYIREELPRPTNIYQSVGLENGGTFRRMSVFAADLSNYESQLLSMGVSQTKVFVKGDILVFVPSVYNFPDWYKIEGVLRFGTKTVTNYVTMLNYVKNGSSWSIATSLPQNIDAGEFPQEIRDSIMGRSVLPPELENLTAMQATLSTNEFLTGFDTDFHIPSGCSTMPERPIITEESREDFKPYSNVIHEFESLLDSSQHHFDIFLESVKSKYSIYEDNDYVTRLLVALRSNLKRRSGENAVTGQSLIKKYLSTFGKLSQGKEDGINVKDNIIYNFDAVSDYVLYASMPSFGKKTTQLCKEAFTDGDKMYCGILSALLGIDFTRAYIRLSDNNISISKVINENPYILSALGLVNFQDAEYLGVLFGCYKSQSLIRFRNMCILHDHIMHSDNSSTAYDISKLSNIGINDRLFPAYAIRNISLFFTGRPVEVYDTLTWRTVGRKKRYVLTPQDISVAIEDYTSTGMGCVYKGCVTSSNFLRKELYIYKSLMENTEDMDYDKADIDKYIEEYESMMGFKLEKEQRMAVHLCIKYSGCITGSAGSGKTTTVGCIVYVLSMIDPALQVMFATPTGKAAKVLQGVVKQPVYTLNVLCRVGVSEEDVFTPDREDSNESKTLYFFDEMGMVSLDLFYRSLRKLHGSRFIFVGDIHQLSSIGKGMVFKNLLKFLPCVYLKVSKRSAENSGITYNSDIVNNYSYRNDYKELKNTSDFKMIPCADNGIKDCVISICDYYLNGGSNVYGVPDIKVSPDDIQVITPVTKSNYSWGSKYLNRYLQDIFNPASSASSVYIIQDDRFVIQDRVIHVKENTYSMQWYSTYKNGSFQKIYGYGVANGQVGRLVAVYPYDMCEFYEEVEERSSDFSYPESLRNDSTWDSRDGYFAVVEYVDSMSDRTFYALYRMLRKDNKFIGLDTGLFELFYAGSTHKMQGSQSKVAICCVGTMNFGSFLTRNMLYTLITRGSDLVILVGSMSQVEKMRATLACKDVLTVQELFV